MGTWGYGPFENDVAADFVDELDEAASGRRGGMVRRALLRAADADGPVSSEDASRAVAAAAVVATRGAPVSTLEFPCAPECLGEDDGLTVDAEVISMASAGLARAVDEGSHLTRLWRASGQADAFRRATEPVRTALDQAAHANLW